MRATHTPTTTPNADEEQRMTTTPEPKITTAGDYIRQELDQAANAFEKQHEHYKTENYLGAAFCGHITQSAFAVVALLETLRRIDPAQADRFAVWLDECQLDGQAAGELWWQWREQLNAGESMTDVGPRVDQGKRREVVLYASNEFFPAS